MLKVWLVSLIAFTSGRSLHQLGWRFTYQMRPFDRTLLCAARSWVFSQKPLKHAWPVDVV